MKRWAVAWLAVLLGCVGLFLRRSSDPSMLRDTDTQVLLSAIRERHDPWSWFAGDWPLGNHFYRPVSTLFFDLDNRLYGNAAWGYGLTNALLCVACTLALFWFLRELTDRPAMAGTGTLLFVIWQTDFANRLSSLAIWLALAAVVGGVFRHRLRITAWAPAALLLWDVGMRIAGSESVGYRTMGWLPGRTATTMTLFALIATAAYARYERLGSTRTVPEPTPLDPPATRSTRAAVRPASRLNAVWGALSVLAAALAFGSYEQAVMLPAVLLGTALTLRWQGFRVRWVWQAAFWGLLVGYLLLRRSLVPADPSSYQVQQFRNGPGVWISLAAYSFPSVFDLATARIWIEGLPLSLMTLQPWNAVLAVAADAAAALQSRRRWIWVVAGLGMSFLAFLPMAWVKPFEHYHYWPLALKSLLVVGLAWIAADLLVSAWSPRTRQAPPRFDPAPGSLPRR